MEFQFIMGNKFYLLFLFLLISCDKYDRKVVTNSSTNEVIPVSIEAKESILLYGINVDSFNVVTKKIKWGQSFSDILSKNGISNQKIYEANELIKPFFNLKKIKKGNFYTLLFKNKSKKPSYFIYESSVYDYIICEFGNEISAKKINKTVTFRDKKISGNIESSLYMSFDENNYPEELIDDRVVGIKKIKAAKFIHNTKTYYAIGYDQGFGNDYFDDKGKSLRKTFLRSPLNFYRISSKFQKKRFHPVLKRYRDHLGTDYAAPRGTPIMSVADGKIVEKRYGRNNGYYIKIKHTNFKY